MSDLLILLKFVLIASRARLAEVQPLMRHLLLLLCLSDRHAVVGARKMPMGRRLHVAVHAHVVAGVLLMVREHRG
jgi:hypothetical protein